MTEAIQSAGLWRYGLGPGMPTEQRFTAEGICKIFEVPFRLIGRDQPLTWPGDINSRAEAGFLSMYRRLADAEICRAFGVPPHSFVTEGFHSVGSVSSVRVPEQPLATVLQEHAQLRLGARVTEVVRQILARWNRVRCKRCPERLPADLGAPVPQMTALGRESGCSCLPLRTFE